MLGRFCLGLLLLGNAVVWGDETGNYVSPDWETLTVKETPTEIQCVAEEGKSIPVRVYVENRAKMPILEVTKEADCLVVKTGDLEKEEAGRLGIQFYGLKPQAMAEENYCLYAQIQGPAGGRGRLFFEGRTQEGGHYWKMLEVTFNGQRQTFPFDQTIPENLKNLFLRFDFNKSGEYRFYRMRVERETITASAMATYRPELIFHVPFDGTAEAVAAGGEKEPKVAKNLTFGEGIFGQAVHWMPTEKGVLEYSLAKNLNPERGTISVWVRSEETNPQAWQTILSMPWQQSTRIGSGAVWFWLYQGAVRGDTSDLKDRYLQRKFPQDNAWHHLVFTWNDFQKKLYIDGKCHSLALSDGTNMAAPLVPFRYSRLDYATFWVGCMGQRYSFNGWMDDLRIYSAPISQEEVNQLYRQFRTLDVQPGNRHFFADEVVEIQGTVENAGEEKRTFTVALRNADSAVTQQEFAVEGLRKTTFTLPKIQVSQGIYTVSVASEGNLVGEYPIWVFRGEKTDAKKRPVRGVWREEMKRKLIEKIDATAIPSERLTQVGELRTGECDGQKYLETAPEAGNRFAIHLKFPEVGKLYCLEYDFPDDACRTVDIVAQSARKGAGSEYELQVGYVTGDEYPNTGKMLTQQYLYWPRSEDVALIFMAARDTEKGAALAEVRVYEVEEELPEANIRDAKPIQGWTRPVGIYFEDPAVGYDFGVEGFAPENLETMLDRIVAYMRYSGQNLFAYPLVWYHGMIGERYNPRNHAPQFFEAFLQKFDRAGLEFMGTINQNNVSFEVPPISAVDIREGKLNDSVFTIHATGTPHPGGWHGTPPIFNVLHPEVQKMTLQQFDEILRIGVKHPSFKGIILHLPRHALHSFGDIRAGYNDYCIEAFEKETGMVIPVDKTDPKRGKLYYEWLMANAREEWVDWRCRKLADWYKVLAKKLSDARADLKLGINCMIPIMYETSSYDGEENSRDFWEQINREAGIDAKYFADVPNMFIEQTVFPADYRWMHGRSKVIRERLRRTEERPGMYASLTASPNAWIHHHDRYWESAIGRQATKNGKPNVLEADWIREHPWRVTTLNPAGFYAMKHYLLPLRYKDIQGISKGGFLIGTYGMEEFLVPFAAAFRALPAMPFEEVEGSSETVKIRKYSDGKQTWFYIANTSEEEVSVTLTTHATELIDLARHVRIRKSPPQTLKLQPYQLRSFLIPARNGNLRVEAVKSI